jgi:hypothetical protein
MSQNGGKKARYGVLTNGVNLYLITLTELGEVCRVTIASLLEIGPYEHKEGEAGGTYQSG